MAYDLFNDLLNQFTTTLHAWQPDLLFDGTIILGGIAAGGSLFVAVRAGIQASKANISGLVFELLFGFFKIGLVYAVMSHVFDWGQGLLDIGTTIAARVSGHSPFDLTPSGLYGLGQALGNAIGNAASLRLTLTHPIHSIATWILIWVVIPLTWGGASLIEFCALMEGLLVVSLGPLIICFAAMEIGFPILLNWVWHLIALALKIMTIVFILVLAELLAPTWIADVGVYFDGLALLESLVLFVAVWMFPNAIAGLVGIRGNRFAFGVGESFMGAVVGAAGGAIAAAPRAVDAIERAGTALVMGE